MIMHHTRETGALRRQLQSLEQKDDSAAPIMSAAPSSSGYNEVTNDMDALRVNYQSWNRFSGTPDRKELQCDQQKPNAQHAGSHNDQQKSSPAAVEPSQYGGQAGASSVMFMLLLCGAFVASRSSSRSMLPRLPEEVKAASSTVLELLLGADSIATTTGQASPNMHTFVSAEPASSISATTWQARASQPQVRPEHLPRSMTTPVAMNEQVFAVLPSEYNSITGLGSYAMCAEASVVAPVSRRNLAEALSGLRTEKTAQGNIVDTYTRSLLCDQIPADVINQFKSMIQDSRRLEEGETRGTMHQHLSLV